MLLGVDRPQACVAAGWGVPGSHEYHIRYTTKRTLDNPSVTCMLRVITQEIISHTPNVNGCFGRVDPVSWS